MAIEIKNNDTECHTWGGKLYEIGEIYTLESQKEHFDLFNDESAISSLVSGKLKVYKSNAEITHIPSAINAIGLMPFNPPSDDGDRPLFRIATTNPDWIYSPRSLDFYTSKNNSLYNREHDGAGIDDGTDIGDAHLHFYDQSGLELIKGENESLVDFQTRLTANCIKTFVDFEPNHDIDIYGAKLMISKKPDSRCYFWAIVAPDIPKAYGGSVPFMGGGWNLQFLEPLTIAQSDGKSSKTIHYDPTNHSGKIRLIVKHGLGEQIGVQVLLEYYKAK